MVTGKSQTQAFPLDFNDASWTLDEVIRNVFFDCSLAPKSLGPEKIIEWTLAALSGDPLPGISTFHGDMKPVNVLNHFFRCFRPDWKSDSALPPIVWSGLAIHYWLKHGTRNEQFLKEFGAWLKTSGNCVVSIKAKVAGKNNANPRVDEIDLAVFLFANGYLNRLIKKPDAFMAIGHKKSVGATILKNNEARIKVMLGPGAVACTQQIVEDALQSSSIDNLSSRRDPKSGRYQFTGRHADLCAQIFRVYREETMPYSKKTIERAIRELVATKRSWKGIG